MARPRGMAATCSKRTGTETGLQTAQVFHVKLSRAFSHRAEAPWLVTFSRPQQKQRFEK